MNLVRFADDFIITGVSREVLEQQVRPFVERFLAERGLELSPDKTVISTSNRALTSSGRTSGCIEISCLSSLPRRACTRSYDRPDLSSEVLPVCRRGS